MYRTKSGTFRMGTDLEAINRLQVDFLSYSYLYYQCDISLIPDGHYDNICHWLFLHKKNEPDDFMQSDFYDLCKDVDESGSGYYLKEEDYPKKIKRICVRLLKQNNQEIPKKLEE